MSLGSGVLTGAAKDGAGIAFVGLGVIVHFAAFWRRHPRFPELSFRGQLLRAAVVAAGFF